MTCFLIFCFACRAFTLCSTTNVYEQTAAAYGDGNNGGNDGADNSEDNAQDEQDSEDQVEEDDMEEEDEHDYVDEDDEEAEDDIDEDEEEAEDDIDEEGDQAEEVEDEDEDADYVDADDDKDYFDEDDDIYVSEDHGEEEEEAQEQEQVEEDGGARKLEQQFDCSRCDELQCFAKDADDDVVATEAADRDEIDTYVAAWIEEVVNCKQTDQFINDIPIYIGPICSEYADTFEIGAFLDEDCTILTSLATFDSIVAAEQQADESVDVAGYAINSLKTASYGTMSCQSPDSEEEDGEEMNDYCKQLFESDLVSFDDCAAQEEVQQQDETDDEYSWYSYDMEDADGIGDVCAKVASFNGEYSNYYDSAASGSVHSRYRNGKLVIEECATTRMSAGAITAIALACTVVIGATAHLLRPKTEKMDGSALNEPMYRGGQMS